MSDTDVRKRYNITARVHRELREWLADYYTKRAARRKEEGFVESPGEQRGCGPALSRVLAWMSTLSDDDVERIQEEGARLEAILEARPRDYAETPGLDDRLNLPRRKESVFRPEGIPTGPSKRHAFDHPQPRNASNSRSV